MPNNDFVVQDKMDGSLILLFCHQGNWITASRGSFESEQSKEAEKMLREKYGTDSLDP